MILVLFILTLAIALLAQWRVKRAYARHSRTPFQSGYAGAEAAHECGHAIQHQNAYAPLQIRMAAVGVTSFASQLVLWIPLLGAFTGLLAPKTSLLVLALAWGLLMASNLVTLPVEFDASRRAKLVLARMGFIQGETESAAVNQVLNAAAWTYVAAFISSLVYFLWHLLPLLTGRSR